MSNQKDLRLTSQSPTLRSRLRTAIKGVLQDSAPAQLAYGTALLVRARTHLWNGKRFAALSTLCQACRQIPSEKRTRLHMQQIQSILQDACFSGAGFMTHAENKLVQEYQGSAEARRIRSEWGKALLTDRVRLRKARPNDDPRREGNLIVLKKPNDETGERGVLLIKYLYSFADFAALFDIVRIVKRFQLVFEPSWTNYIEPYFLLYAGNDADLVVQCTQPRDAQFFETLKMNYRTVALGGGDWVDFDTFKPGEQSSQRDFDVIMIASWDRWKRHHVLFNALARLKTRRLRIALVGKPGELTVDGLKNEMRAVGVEDQCTVFEAIPPSQVADLLARSKVALLLSELEGTNKSVYEAFACNTPVIVYRHHVGLNMSHVNPQTGVLADDDELPQVLCQMVDQPPQSLQPRAWLLENTGYRCSTALVNKTLREMAIARGAPWTQDIVYKVNKPGLQYKDVTDQQAMASVFDELTQLLI